MGIKSIFSDFYGRGVGNSVGGVVMGNVVGLMGVVANDTLLSYDEGKAGPAVSTAQADKYKKEIEGLALPFLAAGFRRRKPEDETPVEQVPSEQSVTTTLKIVYTLPVHDKK